MNRLLIALALLMLALPISADEIDDELQYRFARQVYGQGVPDIEPEPYVLHRVESIEVAEYLVAQGVEVNSLDMNGMTPLGCAALRGNDELVEFFELVGGTVGGGLFDAIARGDSDELAAALSSGEDVNAPGPGGFSALHYAAAIGKAEVASLLLEAGADPRVEMTGKDVPETRGSRLTPLNAAITNGRIEVVELLLEAGALPATVKAARGLSANGGLDDPLVLAVNSSRAGIVKLLLEAGASPEVPSWGFNGSIPLISSAIEFGEFAAAKLLLEYGAKPQGPELVEAARKGDAGLATLLLGAGLKVDSPDYHGTTPLAAAMGGRHWELAKSLLDRGATFNSGHEIMETFPSFDRSLFNAHLHGAGWAKAEMEKRGSWMSEPILEDAMRTALWQKDEEHIRLLEGMGVSRELPPDPRFGAGGTSVGFPGSKDSRERIVTNTNTDARVDAAKLLERFDLASSQTCRDGLAEFYDQLGLLDKSPADQNEALAVAVLLNDHQRVEALINAGTDPEAMVGRNMTPLMLAVLNARASTLELMLRLGANPDAPAPEGDRSWGSLLLLAIKNGLHEKARTLIDMGADCERNVIDTYHDVPGSALHHAARFGDRRLVSYLLVKGADADSLTGGFTPLFMAAKWGRLEVVELLIQWGADINIECANGWTALDAAVDCWTMETLWPLKQAGAQLSGRRELGETVCYSYEVAIQRKQDRQAEAFAIYQGAETVTERLKTAIKEGNQLRIIELIEAGADIKEAEENGRRLIDTAVGRGWLDVVRVLLEMGVDPNQRGPMGKSAMQAGWMMPDRDVLQALLDAGGYVGQPKSLHTLAAKGDTGGIAAELKLKRSPLLEDQNGFRPLHYAIAMGHSEAARMLLEAEIEARPLRRFEMQRERHDPVRLAARFNDVEILKLLLEDTTPERLSGPGGGGREGTPLATAAMHGSLDAAKLLIEAGAPLNQDQATSGMTNNKRPLFYAAMNGHLEMIRLLAEHGATIDFGSGEGSERSPMQVAIQEGREEAALLLLKLGADPKRELGRDSSVLHEAAEQGMDRLVLKLLELGAEVNLVRGWGGDTPLDMAIRRQHWRTAAILRSRGGKKLIELRLEGESPRQALSP